MKTLLSHSSLGHNEVIYYLPKPLLQKIFDKIQMSKRFSFIDSDYFHLQKIKASHNSGALMVRLSRRLQITELKEYGIVFKIFIYALLEMLSWIYWNQGKWEGNVLPLFLWSWMLTKLERNYGYMRHDCEGNKKCGQGDTHEYEDCRANKNKDKVQIKPLTCCKWTH